MIADVDDDGSIDVAVTRSRFRDDLDEISEEGGIYVFEWEEAAGVITVDTLATMESEGFEFASDGGKLHAPIVAELDGDGELEIVVGGGTFSSINPGSETARIHVFDVSNGSIEETVGTLDIPVPGRRFRPMYSVWTPLAADIDDDGSVEILVSTSHGWLVAWEWSDDSASVEPGWPRLLSDVAMTPALVDVDGDADLDMVLQDESGLVHVFDMIGSTAGEREWWQFGGDLGNTSSYRGTTTGGAPIAPDQPNVSFGTGMLSSGPNPFTAGTTLSFSVGAKEHLRIRVYDVAGRVVRTLADAEYAQGVHVIEWNGKGDHDRELPSGVYFVSMETDQGRYIARRVRIRQ